MITLSGTVRNSVQLASLDSKWQQKKKSGEVLKKNQDMMDEERELQSYQKQADDIREGNRTTDLTNKLMSGAPLSPEEKAYLTQNNPQAFKDYEELKSKKDSYRNELKNCKSKADVEKLKLSRMGNYMAQAKEIANDPNIPKDKKIELMQKLSKEVDEIEETHEEFTKTMTYSDLPERTEDRDDEETSDTMNLESTSTLEVSKDDIDTVIGDTLDELTDRTPDSKDSNRTQGTQIDVYL